MGALCSFPKNGIAIIYYDSKEDHLCIVDLAWFDVLQMEQVFDFDPQLLLVLVQMQVLQIE